MANKNKNFFLIGSEIDEISGCRLPSNGQSLSLLIHHHFTLKKTILHSARCVIDEVIKLYEKENIPVISKSNAARKLVSLNSEWIKLKKSKKRTNKTYIKKKKEFFYEAPKTF